MVLYKDTVMKWARAISNKCTSLQESIGYGGRSPDNICYGQYGKSVNVYKKEIKSGVHYYCVKGGLGA